jgi:hypothetical protein
MESFAKNMLIHLNEEETVEYRPNLETQLIKFGQALMNSLLIEGDDADSKESDTRVCVCSPTTYFAAKGN